MAERRNLTEFWIQHGTDLRDDARRAASMELLRKAKEAGVTHMTLGEVSMHRWDLVDDAYIARINEFRKAAQDAGINIVPAMFPIGYGIRYLVHDANLAAGIPARNVPYVVKGNEATPDQAAVPVIANPGFEKARNGQFESWKMDYPGKFSFVDAKEKHSGKQSLRVSLKGELPAEAKGFVRATQVVKVEPFKYYRLSLWIKTEDVKTEREDYVIIWSQNRKRRHNFLNMPVKPTQDWTRHELVFNTFEACEVELTVGTSEYRGGTVWFDDLEVAPAGLLNVVRRSIVPLVVTSADGKTVYKEGKDFERVADPDFTDKSLGAIDHEAPPIRLKPKSRIRNRQKLLVSHFHAMRVYNDQMCLSMEEPRLYEYMDKQMAHVSKLWQPRGYFMNADEIRVCGWENQPKGEELDCAELLARYMKRSFEIVKKYDPAAELTIWSDMFTPFHNGRPFEEAGYYYHCSGTYYGCWKELPGEVRIANWYSPNRLNPIWFETRGHRQVMCGYYDNPNLKANIGAWMNATSSVDKVVGIMYTQWSTGFEHMSEFFRLAKTYPDWLETGVSGESGIKER